MKYLHTGKDAKEPMRKCFWIIKSQLPCLHG